MREARVACRAHRRYGEVAHPLPVRDPRALETNYRRGTAGTLRAVIRTPTGPSRPSREPRTERDRPSRLHHQHRRGPGHAPCGNATDRQTSRMRAREGSLPRQGRLRPKRGHSVWRLAAATLRLALGKAPVPLPPFSPRACPVCTVQYVVQKLMGLDLLNRDGITPQAVLGPVRPGSPQNAVLAAKGHAEALQCGLLIKTA